uniref:Uncharacterized protein n=1 Tax=Caenorhabditis japonica TaxID=281687 RepID=A0A8R1EP78_CAEJA
MDDYLELVRYVAQLTDTVKQLHVALSSSAAKAVVKAINEQAKTLHRFLLLCSTPTLPDFFSINPYIFSISLYFTSLIVYKGPKDTGPIKYWPALSKRKQLKFLYYHALLANITCLTSLSFCPCPYAPI